ncbi:MAG: hypothetical protein IJ654_07510 [Bacteroidales bacterium]|nr:hypothetical protein [Bacteroidales bacterium]
MKKHSEKARENYLAPACSELPFCADAAICETSYDGGSIEPGTGVDWDEL